MSNYFKLYEKTLSGDAEREKLADGCRLVHIYSTSTFRAFYGTVNQAGELAYIGALSSVANDLWLKVDKMEDGNMIVSGVLTGNGSHNFTPIQPIIIGSDKDTLAFWPAAEESFIMVQYGD